jgi:hypothetical protein
MVSEQYGEFRGVTKTKLLWWGDPRDNTPFVDVGITRITPGTKRPIYHIDVSKEAYAPERIHA